MYRYSFSLQPLALAWIVSAILSIANPANGQSFSPLIQFTNVWKYDVSGIDPGPAWRTNDFDDAAWPFGRGLLGFDDVVAPYLAAVPSGLGTPFLSPLSQTVTT